jgi:hypothetical protein
MLQGPPGACSRLIGTATRYGKWQAILRGFAPQRRSPVWAGRVHRARAIGAPGGLKAARVSRRCEERPRCVREACARGQRSAHTCGAAGGWPGRCRAVRRRQMPSRSGAPLGRASAGSPPSTSQSTRSSSSSNRNERVSRNAESACCASADVRHEGNMCSQATRGSGWTVPGPRAGAAGGAKTQCWSRIWRSLPATGISSERRPGSCRQPSDGLR